MQLIDRVKFKLIEEEFKFNVGGTVVSRKTAIRGIGGGGGVYFEIGFKTLVKNIFRTGGVQVSESIFLKNAILFTLFLIQLLDTISKHKQDF